MSDLFSESGATDESASRRFGLTTGLLLVVANMIGVGVFTTTGFLIRDVGSAPAVLIAWCIGGVAAVCGALTYAELARTYPNNGGEYQLLTKIYHPALGFACGCASLVVGFSAPIAAFGMAFGKYLNAVFPAVAEMPTAVGLVLGLSVLHAVRPGFGTRFQNVFTIGKIALIAAFIAGGLWCADWTRLADSGDKPIFTALKSPSLAVGLVFISFTYTGWNAAAYVAGELRNPNRTIPLALVGGTLIVMLLYVGLNSVFLGSASAKTLAAAEERVAHVAAVNLFGEPAAKAMSLLIAIGLVSTVGAMTISGPRVYAAMGADYPALALLGLRSDRGSPTVAILLQSVIAIGLVVTSQFETLMTFIGVTLSLFASLTVLGVFRVRWLLARNGVRTPPWMLVPPLLFIAVETWMIVFAVQSHPLVGVATDGMLLLSLMLYAIVARSRSRVDDQPPV